MAEMQDTEDMFKKLKSWHQDAKEALRQKPVEEKPANNRTLNSPKGRQLMALLEQSGDRVSPAAKKTIKNLLIKAGDKTLGVEIRKKLAYQINDYIKMLEKTQKADR